MAEFKLFEHTFSISDACIRDYLMNTLCYIACEQAEKEFNEWYKWCLGIDKVINGYEDKAAYIISKYAMTPLFKELEQLNIYDISEEMYASKCVKFSNISDEIEHIETEIDIIEYDKETAKEYRAERKRNRSRYKGYGFGVSGAIKASMKAGAMNATTGMAHGVINAIGNTGSSIAAAAKKSALYNDETKENLSLAIYKTVADVFTKHKQLVNSYINGYYVSGFDFNKSTALFNNAKKIPEKRKELLLDAVVAGPSEDILAYIFLNYNDEQKNVLNIFKALGMEYKKYLETSFANLYTEEARHDEEIREKVKAEIMATMQEFGINTSDTLNKINNDALLMFANKYYNECVSGEDENTIIEKIKKYLAPPNQKQKIVKEYGIWKLAKTYSVSYTKVEVEKILSRYYNSEAMASEDKAQIAKKRIVEAMEELGVIQSDTFDSLERDCIARICNGVNDADEQTCNLMRQNVVEYNALDRNKTEYLNSIQKRIEDIWSSEDGDIFDNIYLNTNIYDKKDVDKAISYIVQKARTKDSEKYLLALQSCNVKNIESAKKFQKNKAKGIKIIGIISLLLCIPTLFSPVQPLIVVFGTIGIVLLWKYSRLKKIWNILTIGGTKLHYVIDNTQEKSTPSAIDSIIQKNEDESDKSEKIPNNINENGNTILSIIKKDKTDKYAIISLITAIVAWLLICIPFLCIPVGIISTIFAIIVLIKGYKGNKVAVASVIMNILLVVAILVIIYSIRK